MADRQPPLGTNPFPPIAPAAAPAVGFAEVSRVVVAVAADLVTGVQRAVGSGNIRTARDNAWDAMLADQARNQARADLIREVAQLTRRRPAKRLTTH